VLNQPFVQQGKRAMPIPPGRMAQHGPAGVDPKEVKHFDLTKGRYGVTISIGKAYKSRVEQGADELGQLFQAEPQLFSLLGDIYLKFRDFPGHTEAAERMKKMLPPPLQDEGRAAAGRAGDAAAVAAGRAADPDALQGAGGPRRADQDRAGQAAGCRCR
jgi:hypothetical protein